MGSSPSAGCITRCEQDDIAAHLMREADRGIILSAAQSAIDCLRAKPACRFAGSCTASLLHLDERLLARLDADSEVRRYGRSAVLRRAAEEYLHRGRKRAIASQYTKAYGAPPGLGEEFAGWQGEGSLPEQ